MSMKPDEPSPSRRGPVRRDDPARPMDPPAANASPLLWSLQDVALALNISRRTVQRRISDGTFPKADVRLGTLKRWKPQTVHDWIDRRV